MSADRGAVSAIDVDPASLVTCRAWTLPTTLFIVAPGFCGNTDEAQWVTCVCGARSPTFRVNPGGNIRAKRWESTHHDCVAPERRG